jgi:hypothetical protein
MNINFKKEKKMKTLICSILTLSFFLIEIQTSAQSQNESEHKGFVWGIAGTGGYTTFKQEQENNYWSLLPVDNEPQKGFSFGPTFYIGYGFSEQFILNFKVRELITITERTTHYTTVGTADFNFFPISDNGFYLNAGLGAIMNAPETGNVFAGPAFYGGLGYEFNRKIALGFDYTKASLSGVNTTNKTKASSLAFYIRFLFY